LEKKTTKFEDKFELFGFGVLYRVAFSATDVEVKKGS
jgi:hypothetical protein